MSIKNVPVADLELMTPGSLWLKEINGRTQVSTFLFFANQNVPKKYQKQVPIKAIFADGEGSIYALNVLDFYEDREFHSINPDVEFNVENIFNPLQHANVEGGGEDWEGSEEVEDEDSLILEDSLLIEDDEVGASPEASTEPSFSTHEVEKASIDITYHLTTSVTTEGAETGYPSADPQEVTKRTIGYETLPSLDADGEVRYIKHVLSIDVGDSDLSTESLAEFFRPSDTPFYGAFSVRGQSLVDWDGYLGVFPAVVEGKELLRVVLTTELNQEQDPVVAYDEEVPTNQEEVLILDDNSDVLPIDGVQEPTEEPSDLTTEPVNEEVTEAEQPANVETTDNDESTDIGEPVEETLPVVDTDIQGEVVEQTQDTVQEEVSEEGADDPVQETPPHSAEPSEDVVLNVTPTNL